MSQSLKDQGKSRTGTSYYTIPSVESQSLKDQGKSRTGGYTEYGAWILVAIP